MTADETWIGLYKHESKEQSTMWKTPGSPSLKKFKVSRSTKKQMFIMFSPSTASSLHFLPTGTKQRPSSHPEEQAPQWSTVLFHHDNVPSRLASTAQDMIDRQSIEVLGHPPHSPICPHVISSSSPH